ncbi:MAG: hypothetical protein JWQ04_2767 [Pedosphaera sp.]|nr:hypothetical protein [Pedosphaera sp.]
MSPGWELINAEKMHAESPGTFKIAPRAERESLFGRLVKIGVRNPDYKDARGINGERFWVKVVQVLSGEQVRYRAMVENDLVLGDAHGLKHGDFILFGPEHVLQTEPSAPGARPPAANLATRQFRARLGARWN